MNTRLTNGYVPIPNTIYNDGSLGNSGFLSISKQADECHSPPMCTGCWSEALARRTQRDDRQLVVDRSGELGHRIVVSSINVATPTDRANFRSVSSSAAAPLASDTELKSLPLPLKLTASLKGLAHQQQQFQHQQQHHLLAISRFSPVFVLTRSLNPPPLPLERIRT